MANKIPKSIISQINENCSGGFILFASDSEGSVSCYSHFDNNMFALALSSYVQNWSDAVEQISVDNLVSFMNKEAGEDTGEEDEETK